MIVIIYKLRILLPIIACIMIGPARDCENGDCRCLAVADQIEDQAQIASVAIIKLIKTIIDARLHNRGILARL